MHGEACSQCPQFYAPLVRVGNRRNSCVRYGIAQSEKGTSDRGSLL